MGAKSPNAAVTKYENPLEVVFFTTLNSVRGEPVEMISTSASQGSKVLLK